MQKRLGHRKQGRNATTRANQYHCPAVVGVEFGCKRTHRLQRLQNIVCFDAVAEVIGNQTARQPLDGHGQRNIHVGRTRHGIRPAEFLVIQVEREGQKLARQIANLLIDRVPELNGHRVWRFADNFFYFQKKTVSHFVGPPKRLIPLLGLYLPTKVGG